MELFTKSRDVHSVLGCALSIHNWNVHLVLGYAPSIRICTEYWGVHWVLEWTQGFGMCTGYQFNSLVYSCPGKLGLGKVPVWI